MGFSLGGALKGALKGGTAGAIGAGIGALAGAFSSGNSGAGVSPAMSKDLMRYQMSLNKDYTQWLNENQYGFMRTGLESAGYNPLLALGASPQQGAISPVAATDGDMSGFSGLNAVQSFASLKNTAKVVAETNSIKYGPLVSKMINWSKTLGSGSALKGAKDIVKNIINNARDATNSNLVLKGYVSNTADSHGFDYHTPTQAEYNAIGRNSGYNNSPPPTSLAF